MPNFDGKAYQARFDALAEQGMDVHAEASLVLSLAPRSVLDAGCGTGRVAIQLARHGVEVLGVDVDASMIAEARRRAPELNWVKADLAALELGRTFDVVVLAGNVPLFCPPADRPALVEACASHVVRGGAMVAGFQLDRDYSLDDYDSACRRAGLSLGRRWSTWDGDPFGDDSVYGVSIHQRPAANQRCDQRGAERG